MSAKKAWPAGGVAAVLDSGGARGLFIDLAAEVGVPIAKINAETEQKLRNRLEYGLEPVNPVDAWGTGQDAQGSSAIACRRWSTIRTPPSACL